MTRRANFTQGSQGLLKPNELKALANSLMDFNHPYFGKEIGYDSDRGEEGNYLYNIGRDKHSAQENCDKVAEAAHAYLPQGSQVVQLHTGQVDRHGYPVGNHFINVVPTTEGPHVVDFSHRQFQSGAELPVIQHISAYMQRPSMKRWTLDQESLSPELKANLGEK